MIELDKAAKAGLARRLARHLGEELDVEVGVLQAEMLLDFLITEIGPVIYNSGLADAHAAILRRMDDAADDINVLEKPVR